MIMNMVAGGKTPSGTRNITANGVYDVTDYASVNVNVPDVVDEPVLLWTNPSPSSQFLTQDIAVASGYSGYFIETAYSTANLTDKNIGFVNVGSTLEVAAGSSTRVFTGYDGRINCYVGSIGRSNAIPTRIWGVKFTL